MTPTHTNPRRAVFTFYVKPRESFYVPRKNFAQGPAAPRAARNRAGGYLPPRARPVEPRTTSEVGSRSLHSAISPLMSWRMRLQDSMPTW